MENQINVGDQNTQQIDQNPIVEPVEIPKKPTVKYWVIIIFFVVIVLAVSGFFAVNLYNKKKNSSNQQKSTTGSSQTTEVYQATNPNTGDLYQDIKVRMKELLP